jgi:hypothetical protein
MACEMNPDHRAAVSWQILRVGEFGSETIVCL